MKRRFLFDHGIGVAGAGAGLNRTVKTGELSVRATIVASTLNETERTVDVCFATDAPILMGYWERYYEILSFADGQCDMSRLNAGAPMLDNHDRWGGAAEQPGVVERAWTDGAKGYATLRFANDKSTRDGVEDGPGEKIFQRVKDKIVRNVSVGYTVQKYEEVDTAGTTTEGKAGDNKIPTYRAILWQPFEVSFAPVPADIGAGVRELPTTRDGKQPDSYTVEIISNNQNQDDPMKRRFLFDTGAPGGGGGGAAEPVAAPAAAPAQRSEPATQPATPVADAAAIRSAAIMDLCEVAGTYSLTETRALIAGTQTVEQIRAAIIAKRSETQPPAQHGNSRAANANNDAQREAKRKAVTDSLCHRAAGHLFPLTTEGREFRGLDLMDLAREFAEENNSGLTRGKSKREVAEMALNCGSGRAGMMSTSDLPNVLGNVVNRVLMAAYESQESQWRLLGRTTSFKDFRQKTIVKISEGQDMNLVKEGGEYERMAISDGKETIQAFKYGRIIPITWETFINDDLDALGRIPMAFAEMASRKQGDLVYSPIINNSPMGDGVALFHATHNNLLTGAAINIDSMGLMRKLMRNQKGIAGKQRLNLMPKYMLVGPDMEQLALQYTSSNFVPVTQATENPWKGSYTPVVEARLDGGAWYGFADPARIETFQYGFLEGEGELFTTQREGFEVDGVEIKARMVFGTKFIEYRGVVKNPGA